MKAIANTRLVSLRTRAVEQVPAYVLTRADGGPKSVLLEVGLQMPNEGIYKVWLSPFDAIQLGMEIIDVAKRRLEATLK